MWPRYPAPAVRASWVLVTGPTKEPITLQEAKDHARIVQAQDDKTLNRYIKTAREEAETYMGRGLFTQTWRLSLSDFCDAIYLPMAAPLQSVTSITYYDSDGTLQTLSSSVYVVDTDSRPGCITLGPNQSWPALQGNRFAPRVFIAYVVGWAAVIDIPERIKQGLRMYVAYLDADREGMEQDGDKARKAAESCWDDRVTWIEPSNWLDYYWSACR